MVIKNPVLSGYLSSSMFIHCGAVAAVAFISASDLIKPNVQPKKTTIEFTTMAPKGEQVQSKIIEKKLPQKAKTKVVKKTAPIVNKSQKAPSKKAASSPQKAKIEKPLPAPKILSQKPKSIQKVAKLDQPIKTSTEPSPIVVKNQQELLKQKAELEALERQKEDSKKQLEELRKQKEQEQLKALALQQKKELEKSRG